MKKSAPSSSLGLPLYQFGNRIWRWVVTFVLLLQHFEFLPAATKLGQGNIFTGVCDSVNGGGVCLRCTTPPPSGRHPPVQIPPLGTHPPG